MKKLCLILLAALLAGLTATAAPVAEAPVSLQGVVLEVDERGGYLIETAEYGEVQVLVHEETFMDTDREIAVGDYLYVDYDGRMTRSLPPQITAAIIRMHCLTGAVMEADAAENTVLLQTDGFGEVLVHLPEEWAGQETDAEEMIVYFNGAITMSLPGQIAAGLAVPVYALQGVVAEIGDGSLILGEGKDAVQVNLSAELPKDLCIGDVVRVRYDGKMTRSLPPQITAMELIQISR